jgi:hypothetical protein
MNRREKILFFTGHVVFVEFIYRALLSHFSVHGNRNHMLSIFDKQDSRDSHKRIAKKWGEPVGGRACKRELFCAF